MNGYKVKGSFASAIVDLFLPLVYIRQLLQFAYFRTIESQKWKKAYE